MEQIIAHLPPHQILLLLRVRFHQSQRTLGQYGRLGRVFQIKDRSHYWSANLSQSRRTAAQTVGSSPTFYCLYTPARRNVIAYDFFI